MGISLFNGLGRIFWAAMSDRIGRPNTFIAFFILQIIAFPLLPHLTGSPGAFMAVVFLVITCYGGGFATLPAFISDLFGLKEMPTINGFLLTAWSLAGFVGPMLTAFLHERTGSYTLGLTLCGGVFAVALVLSLLMKRDVLRIQDRADWQDAGNRGPAPELSA
jgi:OFA family oxalate/formate antiporter-like MFS transporter